MSEALRKNHPELIQAFEKVGLRKVHMENSRHGELTLWDGYVKTPHVDLQRFDVKEGDYRSGCYATFWVYTKGDRDSPNAMCGFALFDQFHNAGFPIAERQAMRVRSLVLRAKEEFETAEKIRQEERHGVSG